MIGLSLSVVGILVALVQTWLIGKVHPILGNERSIYIPTYILFGGHVPVCICHPIVDDVCFLVPYCPAE